MSVFIINKTVCDIVRELKPYYNRHRYEVWVLVMLLQKLENRYELSLVRKTGVVMEHITKGVFDSNVVICHRDSD